MYESPGFGAILWASHHISGAAPMLKALRGPPVDAPKCQDTKYLGFL